MNDNKQRLYPTVNEDRKLKQLKEEYGIKDEKVFSSQNDPRGPGRPRRRGRTGARNA